MGAIKKIFDDVFMTVKGKVAEVSTLAADETFTTFALFHDSSNAYLSVCLDTYDNSMLQAKRKEQRKRRLIEETALKPCYFRTLRELVSNENMRLCEFNASYHEMKCEIYELDLTTYDVGSCDDDELAFESYLFLNKLIDSHVFEGLRITSPFRVAMSSPDSEVMSVVRFLNWPPHAGPTV